MPRIPRGQIAGHAYHVINRGNGGATIFHQPGDYRAFLHLLDSAKTKFGVKLFGFCLMPNHFHLVLQPSSHNSLSRMMQWWLTSHVRRYHQYRRTHGHVWQGRFKSFPIQQDHHLLGVLHYVLCNPVRAGLVQQASNWHWSSLQQHHLVDPVPVEGPRNWIQWADEPQREEELLRIRSSVNRQAPYGQPDWQVQTAKRFGLEATLRPRGRPRREAKK